MVFRDGKVLNSADSFFVIMSIFIIIVTWSPTERREIRNYYYSFVFELAKDLPLKDK